MLLIIFFIQILFDFVQTTSPVFQIRFQNYTTAHSNLKSSRFECQKKIETKTRQINAFNYFFMQVLFGSVWATNPVRPQPLQIQLK